MYWALQKKMAKQWLKEIARDLLALGSIPFYLLVAVRSMIGDYMVFVYQMLISAIAIFILFLIIKNSDMHVARSFAIIAFTSMFYNDGLFAFFAVLIWILIIFSAYHLKGKISQILRGALIGVISLVVGYYGALLV